MTSLQVQFRVPYQNTEAKPRLSWLTHCRQTDGLSDNVFPSEMVAICSLVSRQFQLKRRTITSTGESEVEGSAEDQEVQAMAERIVDYARMCMANQKNVGTVLASAACRTAINRAALSSGAQRCSSWRRTAALASSLTSGADGAAEVKSRVMCQMLHRMSVMVTGFGLL